MFCWQNICKWKEATGTYWVPKVCLLVKELLLTNCSYEYIHLQKSFSQWKETIEKLLILTIDKNLFYPKRMIVKAENLGCRGELSMFIIVKKETYATFSFVIIWNLNKNCNSTKNSHVPFTQISRLQTFYHICFIISFSVYILFLVITLYWSNYFKKLKMKKIKW